MDVVKLCRVDDKHPIPSSLVIDGPYALTYEIGETTRPVAGPIFAYNSKLHAIGRIKENSAGMPVLMRGYAIMIGDGEPWAGSAVCSFDRVRGARRADPRIWAIYQRSARRILNGRFCAWPPGTVFLASFTPREIEYSDSWFADWRP